MVTKHIPGNEVQGNLLAFLCLDQRNEDSRMSLHLIPTILTAFHHIFQVVFVSPFEHHANLLPWRESGAEVVWIAEDSSGKTDISDLERKLQVAS